MEGWLEMSTFEVVFYAKPDGTEPAREFLNGLDVKMMAKMAKTIELLQNNGIALREPDARIDSGLTQKQLSDITGITQSDIRKTESGNANPLLRTLQRFATGMGMKMKIEFSPIDETKSSNQA